MKSPCSRRPTSTAKTPTRTAGRREPAEFGMKQLRAQLDGIIARESPPYRTVDQWFLFNLVRLPNGRLGVRQARSRRQHRRIQVVRILRSSLALTAAGSRRERRRRMNGAHEGALCQSTAAPRDGGRDGRRWPRRRIRCDARFKLADALVEANCYDAAVHTLGRRRVAASAQRRNSRRSCAPRAAWSASRLTSRARRGGAGREGVAQSPALYEARRSQRLR